MKLLFATTNPRKIAEANNTLALCGITVEPVRLDIDEIQHLDSSEITKAKARSAYESTQKPVVVSDTSWAIPALNGFPGGYMKDVSHWLEPSDWLALMKPHHDRTIECHEHLVYYDGKTMQHFVAIYKGIIAKAARGPQATSESIEQVAILYGDKTMAEMTEAGELASAGEELSHWKQFGQWYREHHASQETNVA